jgi:prolyl oligopeptidase
MMPMGGFAAVALASVLRAPGDVGELLYPETRREDVVDVYHGETVPDPYRWLEADARHSPEVAAWVAAQNEVTRRYLDAIPERSAIRERLTALWNYERYSPPAKKGGRYFFSKNDGLQNQAVVYVQESLEGEPRVLIDPNTWSEDGTVSLGGMSVSDDGRYAAYGVSTAGSDWRTWRVIDVDTGTVLADELQWTKAWGVAWTRDGKGFFYTRYDEPAAGTEFVASAQNQRLCYHRLGTPQSEDPVVYYLPEHPDWMYGEDTSEDGRYLIITIFRGTDPKVRVLVKDLMEPYGMPVHLVGDFDHEYGYIGNDGPLFYFKTDKDAPRGRIVAIDLRKPEPEHWKELVPQREDALRSVSLVGNLFILLYLQDARTVIRVHGLDGRHVRDVPLPAIGSVWGFGGRRTDTETFFVFSSFATPHSIFRYDVITGETTLLRRAKVDIDPDAYEVKQVFYTSKDGTRVPMFITHRKGLALDGNNPTLLYGYGGFSIPMVPGFSVANAAWLEMGGVFATPNLRGGGEYGEDWHLAATRTRRQKSFDDFIAAAEWLIANGYTRPEKLAIRGGSNGGLLVGAAMTQRPDLFGACLPAVGVMDMLRFHKFTFGRLWVDEYGCADDPEEFKVLRSYSPYHNLREGTRYPATLVTTADTDDRVIPGHSFKFAAALQRAQSGEAPVLIRIETSAGHGAGTPTSKAIEENADVLAFLVKNLGTDTPADRPLPENG